MKTSRSPDIGWVAVQFVLLAAQLRSVFGRRAQWPGTASSAAGVALLAAGAVAGLSGVRALGKNLTPLPEPKAGGELVTTGIFARIRHPLCGSMMALGFGWALLWRSLPALLLAAAQAIFLRAKADREEKRLHARFPDYEAYARRVPRFFPRLFLKSHTR